MPSPMRSEPPARKPLLSAWLPLIVAASPTALIPIAALPEAADEVIERDVPLTVMPTDLFPKAVDDFTVAKLPPAAMPAWPFPEALDDWILLPGPPVTRMP